MTGYVFFAEKRYPVFFMKREEMKPMKTMPRQRFTLRELCLMTFLAVFGMLFKPLVSPAFNLITDFVRVPGGSMTAGFSLLFLVFAAARIRKPGTALLMGLVQAAMSLSMGISATAGILVFITYTMPGAAIDLILCSGWFDRFPLKLRMSAAGAAGVLAGAAFTNMLYFRLPLTAFLLFYLLGILSGACGGAFAWHLSRRLPASVRF